MARREDALGVVLAGGASRRYGSPKCLAELGGQRLVQRVASAVSLATSRVVVVANEPEEYLRLGFAVRRDVRPGAGALGGILTAVIWAQEEGFELAFVAGCDMPFLTGPLAGRLVELGSRSAVAVPESSGPRGVEPLCAAYGIECRQAIEATLDAGERAVVAFFPQVEVRRLGEEEVRRFGDPARLFFNVNRPAELARARAWIAIEARAAGMSPPGSVAPPKGAE